MRNGLDTEEIIFEGNVFVGGVGIFVGQAETDQHAGNFERIVHLRHKGNGAALANKDGPLAEPFFERGLRLAENRIVVRSRPGFAHAQDVEFAVNRFRQQLSNVLFNELRDFFGILIGDQPRRELRKRLRGNDRLGAFSLIAAPDAV